VIDIIAKFIPHPILSLDGGRMMEDTTQLSKLRVIVNAKREILRAIQ
jgi:hypothetical protein